MNATATTAALLAAAVLVLVGVPAPSRPLQVREPRPLPWHRVVPLVAPAVALVPLGPVAAVLALLASLQGLRSWRHRGIAGQRATERSGAAEALAVLSTELRAGRTPAIALAAAADVAVGPLARCLRAAAGSDAVGADPVQCLLRDVEDSAVPEVLRGLAACCQVCASTGSSLAAAVERLAESVRSGDVQRLAVETELAGPRATAGMLAVLPVAGIALAAGLGAHPLTVLLHTTAGMGCLAGGVALDALGLWWTGRIVSAAGGTR
jgi:tight adherence protein B